MKSHPTVAFFDLDHTLLPADSDHGWGAFLVANAYVDADYYQRKNDEFYGHYQAGTLDIAEYCAFSFQVLADNDMATLRRWHAQFMAQTITPVIRPEAIALVQKHKDAGHIPVLISATNEFVITPIGVALGFEHIIGTTPELIDGRYTGRVTGTPSFREGKITRVQAWLSEQWHADLNDLTGCFFYSDSINDLPLLEKVAFPVATNPDTRLTELALARQWPVLQLFHNT